MGVVGELGFMSYPMLAMESLKNVWVLQGLTSILVIDTQEQ